MDSLGRPFKPIKFDEIRHKLRPGRFTTVVAKTPENKVIDRELEIRFKDRQKFLMKSTLLQAKEYFAVGHERFATGKKVGSFAGSLYGLFYRRNRGMADAAGGKLECRS